MSRGYRRWRIPFVALGLLILAGLLLLPRRIAPDREYSRYANEAAAIKAIQTIQTTQVQYNSQYGRFATSLTELGPPESGAANASSADLIDSGLAAGEKSGYKCSRPGNLSGYQISAVPVAYGNTGSRMFYSDQTMAIRENDGPEPATARSKEMK